MSNFLDKTFELRTTKRGVGTIISGTITAAEGAIVFFQGARDIGTNRIIRNRARERGQNEDALKTLLAVGGVAATIFGVLRK